MNISLETIVKGALLHDIGKVVQRAQENPFSDTHGKWGYNWLKETLQLDDPSLNATIMHHAKDDMVFDTNLGLIWYEADNLASSERKVKKANETGKWQLYTSLVSPFFSIKNPVDGSYTNVPSYKALKPLSEIEKVNYEKIDVSYRDYQNILGGLKSGLEFAITKNNFSINFLLMLFEKYLSNVPSTTYEIYDEKGMETEKHPDISLYNHLKLTAAISACLYHYLKETYKQKWEKNELLKKEILETPAEEKPFLLIGGDISGVQKFIYTITSKGALKSLKGRSFYLELLTEHIVTEIIETFNLTRSNLIFSGGGHFYILAYNLANSYALLDKIKNKIDEYLFNEFKWALQIHLSSVAFNKDGFFCNANEIWNELSAKLEVSKKKKWEKKLIEILNINDQHEDCKTISCEVCSREDNQLLKLTRGEDIVNVCPSCLNLYKLGDELSKLSKSTKAVILKTSQQLNNSIKIIDKYYLFESNIKRIEEHLKSYEMAYMVNDSDEYNYCYHNQVFIPVGIYHNKNIVELSDLIDTFGIGRIATLRMDVDNLGKIFTECIDKQYRTFSRLASISNGFNQFFKYHINYIVEGKAIEPLDIANRGVKESGRMVTIVYSGGDDLFLIGHWLDVLEVSYDINKYFSYFTGNPFITVSGGIAINHENYPVYQFANDADEFEKVSKSFDKNAITFLNKRRFSWEKFDDLLKIVNFFADFLKKKDKNYDIDETKLSKIFYYKLLALARRFNKDGVLVLPKAAYLLSRIKGKNLHPLKITKLSDIIMTNKGENWFMVETALLIILMLTRKGGKANE